MQGEVRMNRPLLFAAGIGFIVLGAICFLNTMFAMISGSMGGAGSGHFFFLFIDAVLSFIAGVLFLVFGILATVQAKKPKSGTKFFVAGILFIILDLLLTFIGLFFVGFSIGSVMIFIGTIVFSIFFMIDGRKKVPQSTILR